MTQSEIFALTGPGSIASGASWEEARIIKMDFGVFKTLKHGQKVLINYSSCMGGNCETLFKVGRRTNSKKYGVQKLTLRAIATDGQLIKHRCPFELFERQGRITAGLGGLAVQIERVRFVK